jgi:hypothetical protein
MDRQIIKRYKEHVQLGTRQSKTKRLIDNERDDKVTKHKK